jgi:hypothetical protein
MDKFWVVLRDKVEAYVSKRHSSFEEARTEAERLSQKENARFYVLAVVGYATPSFPPVTWIEIIDRNKL